MNDTTTTVEAMSAVAELWDRVLDVLRPLPPDAWARPTPCARWSVRELAAHLAHRTALDGAVQPEPPTGWAAPSGAVPRDAWTEAGVAARAGATVAELVEELEDAKHLHLARLEARDWSSPIGAPPGLPTGERSFHVHTRAFDLWVHLQDLAVALGGSWDFEDRSAGAVLTHEKTVSLVPFLLTHRAGLASRSTLRLVLDPPLEGDHLVELDKSAAEGAPVHGELRAQPAALTLFVSGRLPAAEAAATGRMQWSGPAAEALIASGVVFS